jgi:molybdopterin adenylyltransferase
MKTESHDDAPSWRVLILTLSDRSAEGSREDVSGPRLRDRLLKEGFSVVGLEILPDGIEPLASRLREACDGHEADLLLTTGGSGLSPRDLTPEATRTAGEREIPGLMELARARCVQKTAFAALGRGIAMSRATTLMVNLPGNPRAAEETLEAMLDILPHALEQLCRPPEDCPQTGSAEGNTE